MCRLFGSRSLVPGGVAHELLHGSNALRVQSKEHPDGWGLGWYEHGGPRVVHSLTPAHGDGEFEKLSAYLNAQTVVAHVRKASIGKIAQENTHPFQRGPWLFCHNGTLPEWEKTRPLLEAHITPALLEKVRGETDSERCFALFLTRLQRRCEIERADLSSAAAALGETVALVREAAPEASTTFLATDGRLMLACRRGRTLHLASSSEAGVCEYVAVSSEDPGDPPPGGRRGWRLVPEDALVGVDGDLRLSVTQL